MRLTPQEIMVIQMALSAMLEDMADVATNPKIPFNPQARKDMRDIMANGTSALKKIQAVSGSVVQLDPYKEGDADEFMTKQS